MKSKIYRFLIAQVLWISFTAIVTAQIPSNVYQYEEKSEVGNLIHELKIDEDYFVHSVYKKSPAEFIKTVGGFYTLSNNELKVDLEFNSDYKKDGIKSLNIPYRMKDGQLILDKGKPMYFKSLGNAPQDLDGKWLFSGRITDEGEERRDTSRPRKTMKFLLNGHFQWIAYNTKSFDFMGTGGGTFEANDGKYTENIAYFSKDNSRVGASLSFNYDLKGTDWHHSGKSSKGAPLNEIWTERKDK